MASIGLKYVYWAPISSEPDSAAPTYGVGMTVGKAVSANLQITRAEAELFADDMLAEYISEFSSAALTMDVDNITLEKQGTLYGATYSSGELIISGDDTAPYGGVGGVQVLLVGGVRKYRAYFFAKAKASVPDWSGTTKGSSISFGTQPMNLKISAPNNGRWYYMQDFDTEAAAKLYVESKLGITASYKVSVAVSGEGTATPEGDTRVANDSSFSVNFSEAPTAVYDNGADVTGSVSGKKYTITSVTGDHSIIVAFT